MVLLLLELWLVDCSQENLLTFLTHLDMLQLSETEYSDLYHIKSSIHFDSLWIWAHRLWCIWSCNYFFHILFCLINNVRIMHTHNPYKDNNIQWITKPTVWLVWSFLLTVLLIIAEELRPAIWIYTFGLGDDSMVDRMTGRRIEDTCATLHHTTDRRTVQAICHNKHSCFPLRNYRYLCHLHEL